MVRCWMAADCSESVDKRSELQLNPPQPVSLDDLKKSTGVLHWKLDADDYDTEGLLDKLRKERGYTYEDFIEISPETLPDYDNKTKKLWTEHFHIDEEIRFALAGSGYFDVRDAEDKWIRILIEKGDLIILPAGLYHRFTLDHQDYIKLMRLFVGESVWKAHYRPAEDIAAKKHYLKQQDGNFN